MNVILSSFSRLRGITHLSNFPSLNLAVTGTSHLRSFSNWIVPRTAGTPQISRFLAPLSPQAEGSGVFQQLPWQYQQVRTRKRGTEYQPKNIKRKRTHGWIKRLSSQGGIEVLLRRMLKGRKSLSH
ncbi:39S ribosomal protein L34, mitochondrial isoform X1 [Amphiprion ocellaris]|uniref:Large ribosomal subunit protein bL34m n=1 Tax=Amphiprion ocellaris TaxID=80972 RepID=A0A3Q1CH21_AMPOC|nr:39S ribosomal protein L34, mitochondrial isoform X1 [Amphiprion ocellaris]